MRLRNKGSFDEISGYVRKLFQQAMSICRKDLGSLLEQYTQIVEKLFQKQFQLKPSTSSKNSTKINPDGFNHQLEQICKDLRNVQV